MNISAIILTHNEEIFIKACLRSVSFAKEIIVVDSGSTDKTIEIAKSMGVIVLEKEWQGFSQQKNYGAEKASQEWLLFIDADERVSQELKQELINLHETQYNTYSAKRLNYILGKPLHHGGWYPDWQRRLVKKDNFATWSGELHESLTASDPKEGKLQGEIIHLTHRGLAWMLQKSINYAQKEAELYVKNNHPPIKVKHFIMSMLNEFYYRAVKEQGYKDGLVGWIEIFYQTFNAFLIKVFIWQQQQKKSMDEIYQDLEERTRS